MPITEQKLPITLYEGISKKRPVVNSDNLFEYLGSRLRTEYDAIQFSDYLDLSYLTPVIKRLYQTTQLGYVHPQETREQLLQRPTLPNFDDPTLESLLDKWHQSNTSLANLQAPVERSNVVYYDREVELYKVTNVKQGDYTSVQHELFEVVDEGNIPLVSMHTHPDPVLPSPQDYMSMIVDEFQERNSLVDASMIVCPQDQILVVATPQTPILEVEEALRFRDYWSEQLDAQKDPRITAFVKRQKGLLDELLRIRQVSLEKGYRQFSELDKLLAAGRITKDEFDSRTREIIQFYLNKNTKNGKKIVKKIGHVVHRQRQYGAQITNEVLMGCARSLNVELYHSQNMRDFKRFTA